MTINITDRLRFPGASPLYAFNGTYGEVRPTESDKHMVVAPVPVIFQHRTFKILTVSNLFYLLTVSNLFYLLTVSNLFYLLTVSNLVPK